MSAVDNGPDSETAGSIQPDDRRWNRFLLISGLFVLYESFLIVVLGDYFYSGVTSELGTWAMVAAAALGYLMLGALAESRASLLVALVPVVVAWTLDSPIPAEAWGGENLPLYMKWVLLIAVFLPAWVLGSLTSLMVSARRNERSGR